MLMKSEASNFCTSSTLQNAFTKIVRSIFCDHINIAFSNLPCRVTLRMYRNDPHNNDNYYCASASSFDAPRQNCDCTNCMQLRSRLRRDGNLHSQVDSYNQTFYPTYPQPVGGQLVEAHYPKSINPTVERRADDVKTTTPHSPQYNPVPENFVSLSNKWGLSQDNVIMLIVFLYVLIIYIVYQQNMLSHQFQQLLVPRTSQM